MLCNKRQEVEDWARETSVGAKTLPTRVPDLQGIPSIFFARACVIQANLVVQHDFEATTFGLVILTLACE